MLKELPYHTEIYNLNDILIIVLWKFLESN